MKLFVKLAISIGLCISLSLPIFSQDLAPAIVTEPAISVEPANTADISSETPAAPVFFPVIFSRSEPDTQILKRTPVIDGAIEEGEWDAFYAISSTEWNAKTFINWDDKNIYIASISSKPVDFMALIDGNNDGWFHGEENFEVKAIRSGDNFLNKSVFRYESRNTISPIPIPVSKAEDDLVVVKSTQSDSSYMIEVKIPFTLLNNIKSNQGKKIGLEIGLNMSSNESGWVPSTVQGEKKECMSCTLVTKKLAQLKPLELGFDLQYGEIARGEEIKGRFHLTNNSSEKLDVSSFIISGEGKSVDYLNSQKIRVEGIPAKKHIAQDYSSFIPSNMPLGSWAIGAEVRDTNNKIGAALISFDVVEPYELSLKMSPTVEMTAKEAVIGVIIKNNMRQVLNGEAKITLPNGWELTKNATSTKFYIIGRDNGSITFRTKVPLGALGNIPVKVEVIANGFSRTVEGSFAVMSVNAN